MLAGRSGARMAREWTMLKKTQLADLPQLTGLRGLAALLVLFGHIKTPEGMTLDFWIADPFSQFGGFGVDMFFVLSGFIMCHVYADRLLANRGILREYSVARFARIYPLHVMTLILMLGAHLVSTRMGVTPTEASGYTLEAVLLSLLLVSEWVGAVAPNPGSWSISVEFANYLLFVSIVPVLARLRRWSPIAIAVSAVALAVIDDWRLMRGVDEFVMGCAVFYCTREFTIKRTGGLTSVLFVAPFLLPAYGIKFQYWYVALCFAAVVFLLASGSPRDPFYWLCASRPTGVPRRHFLLGISTSMVHLDRLETRACKNIVVRASPLFDGACGCSKRHRRIRN